MVLCKKVVSCGTVAVQDDWAARRNLIEEYHDVHYLSRKHFFIISQCLNYCLTFCWVCGWIVFGKYFQYVSFLGLMMMQRL